MPFNDVTGLGWVCSWGCSCSVPPLDVKLTPRCLFLSLCRIRSLCAAAMTMRGWRLSSSGCSTSSPTPSPCSTSTSRTRPYTRQTHSVSLAIGREAHANSFSVDTRIHAEQAQSDMWKCMRIDNRAVHMHMYTHSTPYVYMHAVACTETHAVINHASLFLWQSLCPHYQRLVHTIAHTLTELHIIQNQILESTMKHMHKHKHKRQISTGERLQNPLLFSCTLTALMDLLTKIYLNRVFWPSSSHNSVERSSELIKMFHSSGSPQLLSCALSNKLYEQRWGLLSWALCLRLHTDNHTVALWLVEGNFWVYAANRKTPLRAENCFLGEIHWYTVNVS